MEAEIAGALLPIPVVCQQLLPVDRVGDLGGVGHIALFVGDFVKAIFLDERQCDFHSLFHGLVL